MVLEDVTVPHKSFVSRFDPSRLTSRDDSQFWECKKMTFVASGKGRREWDLRCTTVSKANNENLRTNAANNTRPSRSSLMLIASRFMTTILLTTRASPPTPLSSPVVNAVDPYIKFYLPRPPTSAPALMAPEKPKPVKKVVESLKTSPMATRHQTNNTIKDSLTANENMIQALKTSFYPDAENTVEQMRTTIDTFKSDVVTQQNALQQLEAVIARVQQLEVAQQPAPQDSLPPPTHSSSRHTNFKICSLLLLGFVPLQALNPSSCSIDQAPLQKGRVPYKTICSELRNANINSSSILDVHYSTNKVLALLIHNDYVDKCRALLLAVGIRCIDDFNPYDSKHSTNPQFKDANVEERSEQMAIISVARDFHRKGLITTLFWSDLVKLHPNHEPDKSAQQHSNEESHTPSSNASLAATLRKTI
ncbi:hypothetical protein [Parasitella parasitica]|uniref:Uncharacterized protein n=1 Tax=Parasitella parasitica TaxID=35722 RepID=A0A0B7N0W6_9FUNG|nr:hypothetical protein [Parasitella parasitica]